MKPYDVIKILLISFVTFVWIVLCLKANEHGIKTGLLWKCEQLCPLDINPVKDCGINNNALSCKYGN